MKHWLMSVAVAVAATVAGGAAQAATANAFARVTNDGVFTLTSDQQAFLGTTATNIGFLRGRAAAGDTIAAGTTFDASTVAGRCSSGCAAIQGFLNGNAADVTYSGDFLDPLGTTTIDVETGQAVSLVAFLFGGTGNIVFNGTAGTTATFNAGASRGDLDFNPAPVPLPAAGWLLVAGIGGLAALRRRKAAATA